MPRIKGQNSNPTERFNIRLDEDTAIFYRKKAQKNGTTLSDYLRQTLTQGVIADNVQEIEWRLKQIVEEIKNHVNPSQTALPDEVMLSIFTTEALLVEIVESRDIKQLYAAQDRAKARLERLKANS